MNQDEPRIEKLFLRQRQEERAQMPTFERVLSRSRSRSPRRPHLLSAAALATVIVLIATSWWLSESPDEGPRMAAKLPGSKMAAKLPGSEMAAKLPGSKMAAKLPGSKMAAKLPGMTWSVPSDFLLETPGRELLGELSIASPWLLEVKNLKENTSLMTEPETMKRGYDS